jgi:uncharacterized protein with HEPN domain
VRRDSERLSDIVEAADKIAARVARGRPNFDADEDTQIVLVHLIQVIGEAASGLSDEFTSEHSEIPWRQIVAVRNRVVHGYFEVDVDILWDVAVVDVPGLAEQMRVIKSELADGA